MSILTVKTGHRRPLKISSKYGRTDFETLTGTLSLTAKEGGRLQRWEEKTSDQPTEGMQAAEKILAKACVLQMACCGFTNLMTDRQCQFVFPNRPCILRGSAGRSASKCCQLNVGDYCSSKWLSCIHCLLCMLARTAWQSACSQTLTKLVRSAQTAGAISKRDEYAAITDRDIAFFRDVLGNRGVVTDPDALQPLNK